MIKDKRKMIMVIILFVIMYLIVFVVSPKVFNEDISTLLFYSFAVLISLVLEFKISDNIRYWIIGDVIYSVLWMIYDGEEFFLEKYFYEEGRAFDAVYAGTNFLIIMGLILLMEAAVKIIGILIRRIHDRNFSITIKDKKKLFEVIVAFIILYCVHIILFPLKEKLFILYYFSIIIFTFILEFRISNNIRYWVMGYAVYFCLCAVYNGEWLLIGNCFYENNEGRIYFDIVETGFLILNTMLPFIITGIIIRSIGAVRAKIHKNSQDI